MNAFWERLRLDEASGAIYDGDRRYLMIRPDVLMGLLHALPSREQAMVLKALATSAREQGGRSVSAYQNEGGKAQLEQTMIEGAAALGWGKWRIAEHHEGMQLEVDNSPFAHGYGPAGSPVCAPIAGIFESLAEKLLGEKVTVAELVCTAQHGGSCHFVASRDAVASSAM